MSKRTCTESRPCKLTTCYGCARKLIDDLAGHMLDQGVSQDRVDAFRYPAINALARQIPAKPQAPAKARKAPEAMTPEATEEALVALRKCMTREGARKVLAWFTVVKLRQIAKAIDLGGCGRYRKDALIEHLIDFTVQMKLDHNAILNAK